MSTADARIGRNFRKTGPPYRGLCLHLRRSQTSPSCCRQAQPFAGRPRMLLRAAADARLRLPAGRPLPGQGTAFSSLRPAFDGNRPAGCMAGAARKAVPRFSPLRPRQGKRHKASVPAPAHGLSRCSASSRFRPCVQLPPRTFARGKGATRGSSSYARPRSRCWFPGRARDRPLRFRAAYRCSRAGNA